MPQVFTSKENIGTLSKTSNTIITLTPSRVTIGGLQYINLANVTINTGTTGIGGLDTGSIQANKVYNVFAVPNSGFLGIVASLASAPNGFSVYNKIGGFSTNVSSEIYDVWKGDKTLWQKKILSATYTTVGINTLGNLSFNNLTIGKSYEVTIQGTFKNSVIDNLHGELKMKDGAVDICKSHVQNSWNSSSSSSVFIATSTTLAAEVYINIAGTQLLGDGTSRKTYTILEELPSHAQTTQWT